MLQERPEREAFNANMTSLFAWDCCVVFIQVNDSSSWMGPMGQSASMVPPMQPYAGMMGQQPFQNPSQFNLPANMANPPSAIPPSSQMNAAMQFGTSGQFPYGTWPNDQGWMQHAVGGQPQTVKPAGNMPGMGGMDVQASPSVADMASQSLPDLGDVGLADGKARSTSCRELVNGDVSANANSGPQPGMAVFNSMVSPSPVGPSQATDASGAKVSLYYPFLIWLLPVLGPTLCFHDHHAISESITWC